MVCDLLIACRPLVAVFTDHWINYFLHYGLWLAVWLNSGIGFPCPCEVALQPYYLLVINSHAITRSECVEWPGRRWPHIDIPVFMRQNSKALCISSRPEFVRLATMISMFLKNLLPHSGSTIRAFDKDHG